MGGLAPCRRSNRGDDQSIHGSAAAYKLPSWSHGDVSRSASHLGPESTPRLGRPQCDNGTRVAWFFACTIAIARHTLITLHNQRPTWLALAHQALDRAVFAAYGWVRHEADRMIAR
jgi:hypothetical protein